MTTDVLTLSHSQLETFEQCPRRWELTKIHRVHQAPSEALIYGDAIHQAIEADGRAAVAGEQRHSIPQLVGTFSYVLGQRLAADDPQHLLRGRWSAMRLRGLATLRAYHEQFASAYHPDEVEAPFPEVLLPSAYSGVPDVRFTGRLDARVGRVIVDFKTASKAWAPGVEHQKPQALAYLWADALARGEEQAATTVRFVVLSATSVYRSDAPSDPDLPDGYVASVDIRATMPRRSAVEHYAQRVRSVAQAISVAKQSGQFSANTGPLCGWCGCLGSCPSGQRWLRSRGRTPAVPLVDGATGLPLARATQEGAQ